MNNRIADDNREEKIEEAEIMEYINDCNCLRNRIKQRIEGLINTPLTGGVMFTLCIYQFMIIVLTYIFILRVNIIEHCLWIFMDIVDDQIIALVAKTIKIIMLLHLFEELRLFMKGLLCKCDINY